MAPHAVQTDTLTIEQPARARTNFLIHYWLTFWNLALIFLQTCHSPPTKPNLNKVPWRAWCFPPSETLSKSPPDLDLAPLSLHPLSTHFQGSGQIRLFLTSLGHSDYSRLRALSHFPLSHVAGNKPILLFNVPHTVICPPCLISPAQTVRWMEAGDHVSYFMFFGIFCSKYICWLIHSPILRSLITCSLNLRLSRSESSVLKSIFR